MSSALPLASAAAVDVAPNATVAANNVDADGPVIPPSCRRQPSTTTMPTASSSLHPQPRMKARTSACRWRSKPPALARLCSWTALDRWATIRLRRFGPVGQEDHGHGGPRRFDLCERSDHRLVVFYQYPITSNLGQRTVKYTKAVKLPL